MKKIYLLGLITGIFFSLSIGVYAASQILAKDILFDNSKSKLSSTNVQEAIDEIYGKMGNDTCGKVSEPVIKDGLIPVTITDEGIVKYANTRKEWYNYCKKEWANAVILIESPSKEYSVGDTIEDSDIESYFVWIPKYKYKLWNINQTAEKKAHSISIIFDTTDTIDGENSCQTPMTSGNSGNCHNGDFMTHPAFISMGVNGFWAGKFETGFKGQASVSPDSKITNVNDSSKVIIQPNVYSWRNSKVSNMFLSSYSYKRDLDSHMMKNTEWGAVVYLSHSNYGINYELNINNNSSYLTGYSALLTTQQGTYPGTTGNGTNYNRAYNTETGYLASTTGNISGIYDMSGGAYEYVAGYCAVGSSGFTTTTIAEYDAKYFDVYNSSSGETTYQYRILGDATGEMGPFIDYKDGDTVSRHHNQWYHDNSTFIQSSAAWFERGGFTGNGGLSGGFFFRKDTGALNTNAGFRIVLSPTN